MNGFAVAISVDCKTVPVFELSAKRTCAVGGEQTSDCARSLGTRSTDPAQRKGLFCSLLSVYL